MTAPTVRLLVDDPLRMFLRSRNRGGDLRVAHDGTSSLGHLVQSAGVPLPEVGRLLVDGTEVTPSYRPRHGDVVRVEAVTRPQPLPPGPPRFLLDVHLGTLARRLRLLGLDTAYDSGAHDDELVRAAVAEGRVLLTKDRGLLRRRDLPHAAYVRGTRGDDQLADVLDRFAPPLAPYTRCTACNGVLRAVAKADIAARLEPGTARNFQEFAQCTACERVFWRGAHARRLDVVVGAAVRRASPRTDPGGRDDRP